MNRIIFFALQCVMLAGLLLGLGVPGAPGGVVVAAPLAGPDAPADGSYQIFFPYIPKNTLRLPVTHYDVVGSPYAIAVESPTRAWFTLPDRSAVGRLTATLRDRSVAYFLTPTAGAEPYGVAYTAGIVWITERAANRLARLDVGTGDWQEFPLPTPAAAPTGLAVMPGLPDVVWFAERDANRLGRLTYRGPADYTVEEFPLPVAGGQPEDVFIQSPNRIWFTLAGASRIGRLTPGLWPSPLAWATVWAGTGSRPWAIVVDSEGYPWFTERAGNRIGQFFPQTIADIRWYLLPQRDSDPFDLALGAGRLWFTELAGERVGQLYPRVPAFYEQPLPGAAPTGIAVDAEGCAWIAASAAGRISRWCPPYLRQSYVPLIWR